MQIDVEEKRLRETFSKLDPINRYEVLSRAELCLKIQEATKKRMIELLTGSSPEYTNPHPAPMGAVQEAANA